MSAYTLQALPATFHKAGDHVMVTVPMRAVPIIRETVEVRTLAEAVAAMDSAKARLAKIGTPYQLSLRLADARAPRGSKAWPYTATRHDEAFGQVSA